MEATDFSSISIIPAENNGASHDHEIHQHPSHPAIGRRWPKCGHPCRRGDNVSDAFAKEADIHSANAVVPGCRFFDGSTTSKNPRFDPFGQGYCVGLLNGLDYDGVRCRPPEIAWGQLVRDVLKYIDIRPERIGAAPTNALESERSAICQRAFRI
jgi:hypothetical protein